MPLWVSFEGLPNSGKSTTIAFVHSRLKDAGFKAHIIATHTAPGAEEIIRALKLEPSDSPQRLHLFKTLRLMQYAAVEGILESEHLTGGLTVVLTDRSLYSTIAYEQYGKGVPAEEMDALRASMPLQPDLTFYMDVPIRIARERAPRAATYRDKDTQLAVRVQEGFNELYRQHENDTRHPWIRIDAQHPLFEVQQECCRVILAEVYLHARARL